MGIIILIVILIIVIGVGLSFFGNTTSYMSDRNPRDRFSNDANRDRFKSKVNAAMKHMEYIGDDAINKESTPTHDATEPTKVKENDNDEEDDFLKEYDDFFEQEDDPFNT